MNYIFGTIYQVAAYLGGHISTIFNIPMEDAVLGTGLAISMVIFFGPIIALLIWLGNRPVRPSFLLLDVAKHERTAHAFRKVVAPLMRDVAAILEDVLKELRGSKHFYTHYVVDERNERVHLHYHEQGSVQMRSVSLPLVVFNKKPAIQREFITAHLTADNIFDDVCAKVAQEARA